MSKLNNYLRDDTGVFLTMLHYTSDIIILLDKQGNLVEYSLLAEKFFGWKRENTIGKSYQHLIDTCENCIPFSINKFQNSTHTEEFEHIITWESSQPLFIHCLIAPLHDDKLNGGFLIIGKDITDKTNLTKQSERIENYLQTISSTMPGNFYWKDLHGRYLSGNSAMNELLQNLGFEGVEDIKGKTDHQLWPERAEELVGNDQLVMSSKKAISFEETVKLPKSTRYFTVIKMPLLDEKGEVAGIIGNSLDITELKIAKEKAEAVNEAKEEFLRNMRHDLRTPFSGILTLAQLMADDETDPEKRGNLQDIADSAKVLLEYMNKILDQSQLGAQAKEIESNSVYLNELLNQAMLTIKPTADANHIHLHTEYATDVPGVITDKWRLQRIVMNLLGNAVKFTHKGNITLGISIVSETSENAVLEIWVKDTGIGIPKEKYEEIFEKFTRLEAAYTGKYPGTGLGLYDVRQLCHELGGEITVKSELDKGSLFTCTLPFKKSKILPVATPVSKPTQPVCSPIKALRVLLVEDQEIAAMSAARMMRSRGYTVDVAETGFVALDKFHNGKYDLILMDIGLPDINGISVTKKIRQLEKDNHLNKTPVIAVTAHTDRSEEELKVFDKVCIKPFSSMVFETIDKLLSVEK